MTGEQRYQSICACDECKQVRLCLWTPAGPFRGTWRCSECEKEDNEAMADIVKAATNKLRD